MLASLILESGTCYFDNLAGISVMRVQAPSPWILLVALKVTGKRSLTFLLLLLSVLSLGLQFSSTILFADFAPGRLKGSLEPMEYTYDLDFQWNRAMPLAQIGNYGIYDIVNFPPGLYSGLFQSVWTQRPKIFPILGEYRQSLNSHSGVDDSGYIYTSFLPFDSSSERTRIANFKGPAWILDTRVSCQKPHFLEINKTQAPSQYTGDVPSLYWYSFNGTLENSTEVEGLWFPTNASRKIPFNCQFEYGRHARGDPSRRENAIGFYICQLQGLDKLIHFPDGKNEGGAVLQATESAGSLRSRLYPYDVTDSFPARGPAFLVIASNITLNQNQTSHEAFTKLSFQFDPPVQGLQTAVHDVFFSLCYTSWGSMTTYVEMATSSPLEEPSVEVRDGDLDLDTILHHYGVGTSSAPRAILNLKEPHYNMSIEYPIQQPTTERFISGLDFNTLDVDEGLLLEHRISDQVKPVTIDDYKWEENIRTYTSWPASVGNITVLFQYRGVGPNDEMAGEAPAGTRFPDPSYQEFFAKAMNNTNDSPALSLSALLTFVSSSAYYDQFPIYTRGATGEFTLFMEVSYPQSKKGLIAVISMMIAHWLICFYVLYLFLSTTKFSRLGNAWANVAQISGSETKDILEEVTLASDREVAKRLMCDSEGRRRIVIKTKTVSEVKERVEAVLTT
ncbi:hypothetical protein F4777DRAFT_558278 [Nemania sp. FL0916]|nr:hypothetical protein F4777DRAFT_558278 [Nemania sp. FL0916]